MTRRLLRLTAIGVLTLVVGWFCTVASNPTQHASETQGSISSCANCHTDSQASALVKINEEKDEIEPTPPPLWVRQAIPLASLYIYVPIIFLGYLIQRHKIHLTTQMRF